MKATITINPQRIIGNIDPEIYGQFLCRRLWAADKGLYYPGHPDADEFGLRKSVVNALAAVKPSLVRWPGGCTGTSYDWQDGIGPAEERQKTVDVQFASEVTNGFGTAEFVNLCRRIGAEPHLNISTGLGTMRDAIEWIEYCNYTTNTKFANLRRSHGYEEPFNVKYWQIGNENYGRWELGQGTPDNYSELARQWAKAVKKIGRKPVRVKVLAVGASDMPNYIDWDYQVLTKAWDYIDYLTTHRYWNFATETPPHKRLKYFENNEIENIVAAGHVEEQTILAIGGLIDLIARDKHSDTKPKLAFTEWNSRLLQSMKVESGMKDTQFRLADALACATFMNAMQRQCNIVGLATFAQSINVCGMLYVDEESVVKETVYWPVYLQRLYSGEISVDNFVQCDSYNTVFKETFHEPKDYNVPYLDVSTTINKEQNKLFISVVNRNSKQEAVTKINMINGSLPSSIKGFRLWHENPLQRNTVAQPDSVKPIEIEEKIKSGNPEIVLPPFSHTILICDY